jgi:hypothetical protein
MLPILLAAMLTTSPSAVAADSLDACGLYPRDEVAKFAGEQKSKMPRAFTINPSVHSSCSTESGNWTIKVYLERSTTKEDLAMKLKALKGVVKNETSSALKPVSGLGDEAYWGQISPTNGQFHVVVGLTLVNIQTFGRAPGAGTMEKTRPIADIVVQRYKAKYGSK